MLLEAGAEPDPDSYQQGVTPLAFAAQDGWAEVVRVLLESGSDDGSGRRRLDAPLRVRGTATTRQFESCLQGAPTRISASLTAGAPCTRLRPEDTLASSDNCFQPAHSTCLRHRTAALPVTLLLLLNRRQSWRC